MSGLARETAYAEFFDFLMQHAGSTPADALGINQEHYVLSPVETDWIAFGDRSWDTGVFYGPPHSMKRAREVYPFFIKPPGGFRVEA
jgi:hypothetical protein